MRAVVIYESMYGNTHAIAERVAAGLRSSFDVQVVPVGAATAEQIGAADLVVGGGPTHVHGLSSERTRGAAATAADKAGSGLSLEPDAAGLGLRDWFATVAVPAGVEAAAFDTRIDAPALVTGRAAKGIARNLRRLGFRLVLAPESFLVDKHNQLVDGEADRAEAWGSALADAYARLGPRGACGPRRHDKAER